MIPIRVSAKDFLVFDEFEYYFKNAAINVEGRNEDDAGQESNGTGKTSLFSLIEFAFLGENSQKDTLPELVRFGQKKAIVQFEIYCPIRKESLLIDRVIPLKGSQLISIKMKKDSETEFTQPKNVGTAKEIVEKFISDWINIDIVDIKSFFMINEATFKSFFTSMPSKKVELLNRFSKADILTGIDECVNEDVKVLETAQKEVIRERDELIGGISQLEKLLSEEINFDFEADKSKRISGVKASYDSNISRVNQIKEEIAHKEEEIGKIDSVIAESTKSMITLSNNLKSKDTENPYTEKISSIQSLIEAKRKEKDTTSSKKVETNQVLDEIQTELASIEKNLKGVIQCPNCAHEFFAGDPEMSVEEEKKMKKEFQKLEGETNSSISELTKAINSISDSIKELSREKLENQTLSDEFEDSTRKLKDSISNIESDIKRKQSLKKTYTIEIENLRQSITSISEKNISLLASIQEIEKEKPKNSNSEKYRGDIESYNEKIENLNEEIIKKNDEIFEVKKWIANFKNFSYFLAGKPIKIIESYCNYYLQEMKTDLFVEIEAYKTDSKGNIKDEITVFVSRKGTGNKRKYRSFSKGERGRLELAMILALQNIINDNHEYGGLHFLLIDEIFDGLDALGMQLMTKSLRQFQFPIMLITHVVDRDISTNKLIFEKRNGVTKIINQ